MIAGRAGPGRKKILRAGPEISARLTPLVHNIQTLSVNQWEGNAGKMENTNTQIQELYFSICMQQKFHVMWKFLLEIPIC